MHCCKSRDIEVGSSINKFVILKPRSLRVKDLLFGDATRKQVLRYAQDDKRIKVGGGTTLYFAARTSLAA